MQDSQTQEVTPEVQARKDREAKLETGDKVYFKSQKSPMTIQARNERYAILTEPFYRQKTVYYSILDFEEQWKAPNDRLFSDYDYEDKADIERSLEDLVSGKIGLSQRRGCKLDIDWEKTEARKAKISKQKQ